MTVPDDSGAIQQVGETVLADMHRQLIEVLRHREQEIMRYLAILGPALGGFAWLLHSGTVRDRVFAVETMGILSLLLLGVVYTLALGYNYRYVVLQLAKMENHLRIGNTMLVGWPRSPDEFIKRYNWYSAPPELIGVFYRAFLVAIMVVTVIACIWRPGAFVRWAVVLTSTCSLVIVVWVLRVYGKKLIHYYNLEAKEPEPWGNEIVPSVAEELRQ